MSKLSEQTNDSVTRWLTKAREHQVKLRQLIADYHPSARRPAAYQKEAVIFTDGDVVAVDAPTMPITAPAAEQACQQVRTLIRKEEPIDPLIRWDNAIANGDVGEIDSLLNGAWFGVPESTSCWSIPGFSEAVELIEDPPDMEVRHA
jgi:hypothetical protein